MSEYQYYEFLALDRPLDARQQAELRSLSTRARITATSFVNEYHWGDFRGNPRQLMERYYDAHLYLANWGTRRIMLRMPRSVLDLDVAEQYCLDHQVVAWTSGEHLVLDLTSDDEYSDWEDDAPESLSAIVGIRSELAAGDHRPLYLAWLAGYGTWERDEYAFDPTEDDELEPPLPPGLRTLTAAQRALGDFLRLDHDLLTVAAEISPPLEQATDDPRQLTAWVTNLSPAEKDHLLVRILQGRSATVRMEMLCRFQDESTQSVPSPPRRTIADLLDQTARRRAERHHQESRQRAEEDARRKQARALAREQRLDELARDKEGAWSKVDAMIGTRKPTEYDAAVSLLTDLRALAERDARSHEFAQRAAALRQQHARKPSLLERLNHADL
ncbi:hypothetical protein HUO13_33295 [Saccharopolyspora erythraea]|uniref:hypothetical protein n=1 Tax=Saccharopolyspora erythraea TaxID=1836 RepID=UPI001BA5B54A|nr:hypothetical protein [Saccharopolyspora erythraea]QUH05010.1 hypothetical protein HUO13_33295 [Saccharopolyspora erythraea]